MLDLAPVFSGQQTLAELVAPLTVSDLRDLTNEMIDAQLALIADATDSDAVFTPVAPRANDTTATNPADSEIPWTLGHVIVHTTASSEEAAAQALTLARGLPVEGRSRYESLWEQVTTAAQLVQRLEESRRMRLAMLAAWPDAPRLDVTYTPFPSAGEVNAVGRFVFGLAHDRIHLGQIEENMRHARAARGA